MSSGHDETVTVAFDPAAAHQFAGCGITAGDGEHPPDGIGIRRVPIVLEPVANRSRSEDPRRAADGLGVGGIDARSELFEELVVGADQVGGAREQRDDVASGDVIEQREGFVADPVAAESTVVVRGVVGHVEPQLRAQRLRLGSPEGEDGMPPSWPDRSEAGGSRPTDQREEQRLGLIVGGVAGQGVRPQRLAACGAGPCLEVRAGFDVDLDRTEPDLEPCRSCSCDLGIGIRRWPQAVVDVDRRDLAAGRLSENDQGGRIGASGQPARDSGAGRWKGAPAEEVGGVEQNSASVVDRQRSVWWCDF